jgi:hypothetical protein
MVRLVIAALTLLTAGFASSARLTAADPLDCVPPSAQIVIVADNPRKLAESITQLGAFMDAQKLATVRQLYDSTLARRAFQLLAFAEKDLGAKWPELLDQLAGNGVALAFHYDGDDLQPSVFVAEGRDEKQSAKAVELIVGVIDAELARQGSKESVKRTTIAGVEAFSIGDGVHFARVAATLLVSTKAAGLEAAIKAAMTRVTADPKAKPHPARAAALGLLPKNPVAWLWVDLASIKKSKASKDFFDSTRQDFLQTLVLGATIDTIQRSNFLALGLYAEKTSFRLALRMPAGRDGMWSELAMHVPPKSAPGTLPLLDPAGTIYSHSLHLDVGYLWKHRDKLLAGDVRTSVEMAEKQLTKILPSNVRLGELLEMWGPYHRVVVVNHDQRPYKTEPARRLPAFGYVGSARDKKFGSSLDPVLRAAGLVGTLQYGLKMTELVHDGVPLVAYRFPENKTLAEDPDGLRFNFEPCFAVVGEELVLASTVELAKKLITELKKPRTNETYKPVLRGKFNAANAGQTLGDFADSLTTDTVLSRGIGLAEARQETAGLVAFVKTLGTATVELDITESEYRVDVVWNIK